MSTAAWVPALGSRVLVAPDADLATVRYVGPVTGTDGDWVGVEFDAPGRGKHDGSHNGVRYFACAPGAGAAAASFVRPHKLSAGVTLLEALVAKYDQARVAARGAHFCRATAASVVDERLQRARVQGNAGTNAGRARPPVAPPSHADGDAGAAAPADVDDDLYVRSGKGRRIVVELCMKDELMAGQRNLAKLTRAYLPDAAVATVGPPGELATQAGAITVLDLQARQCGTALWPFESVLTLRCVYAGSASAGLARGSSPGGRARQPANIGLEAR